MRINMSNRNFGLCVLLLVFVAALVLAAVGPTGSPTKSYTSGKPKRGTDACLQVQLAQNRSTDYPDNYTRSDLRKAAADLDALCEK